MAQLLDLAKVHCFNLIQHSRCYFLPYHNWQHTQEVYGITEKISSIAHYSREEIEPLLLAALFHDTGNAAVFRDHEEESARNAHAFLVAHGYPEDLLMICLDCIMATRLPQSPSTEFQQIIADADLFHLGSVSFFEKLRLLRKEWANFRGRSFSDRDWYRLNIDFLTKHRYHTTYGRKVLQPVKKRNIDILTSRWSRAEKV